WPTGVGRVTQQHAWRAARPILFHNANRAGAPTWRDRSGEERLVDTRVEYEPQPHLEPAYGAAILKKSHGMLDKKPLSGVIPGRIKSHIEPVCQPFEGFGGGTAHIEKELYGRDLVFQGGVKPFEIGEQALQKRG